MSHISHELKTPLGIIKGYAEGIQDGVKEEKREYYMGVILEEIDRMNHLILNMLELSKQEYNALNNQEYFNIKGLIEKSCKTFEVQLKQKGMSISIDGDFKDVWGSKFNISGVIVNLLSNAIKYGYEDSIISIRGKIVGDRNYV